MSIRLAYRTFVTRTSWSVYIGLLRLLHDLLGMNRMTISFQTWHIANSVRPTDSLEVIEIKLLI